MDCNGLSAVGPPECENAWLRVTSRKNKQRNGRIPQTVIRGSALSRLDYLRTSFVEDDNMATMQRKFLAARSRFSTLGNSLVFLNSLLLDLASAFPANLPPQSIDILCLGLGNPAADRASLSQLALLDLLIERDNRFARTRTRLYDPMFRCGARRFISELGMQICDVNKEGCYALPSDRYHFVILPHCSSVLLNNLLRTNWNKALLSRLVLFSNGWNEARTELTSSGTPDDTIAKELACIKALEPLLTIGACNNVTADKRIREEPEFEGMRVQWFSAEKLEKLELCPVADLEPISIGSSPNKHVCDTSNRDALYSDLITTDVVFTFIDAQNCKP